MLVVIQKDESHWPVKLTQKHIDGLNTLADFLEHEILPPDSNGPHFTMRTFFENPTYAYGDFLKNARAGTVDTCGSAACAAGWAAIIHKRLGRRLPFYREVDDAGQLVNEVNWGKWCDKLTNNQKSLRYWLFAGNWAMSDDTTIGAARRIRYALKYGIPKFYQYTTPSLYNQYAKELDTQKEKTNGRHEDSVR